MADKNYPPEWRAIRRETLLRANYRCAGCGKGFGAGGRSLDPNAVDRHGRPLVLTVHHVDGNKFHNLRSNLVALCRDCHDEADRNLRRKGA
jgi:5-methylcytosine-specific restriction endonuclease McrA